MPSLELSHFAMWTTAPAQPLLCACVVPWIELTSYVPWEVLNLRARMVGGSLAKIISSWTLSALPSTPREGILLTPLDER